MPVHSEKNNTGRGLASRIPRFKPDRDGMGHTQEMADVHMEATESQSSRGRDKPLVE